MKKILVLMTVLFSFSALADITCKLESLNEFHEPVKTLYTETQKPGQMTASGTWDFEKEFSFKGKDYYLFIEASEDGAAINLGDLKKQSLLLSAVAGFTKPGPNDTIENNYFAITYVVPSTEDMFSVSCFQE